MHVLITGGAGFIGSHLAYLHQDPVASAQAGTRLFANTIKGPCQMDRYGMVVPRFAAQAVRNEPVAG